MRPRNNPALPFGRQQESATLMDGAAGRQPGERCRICWPSVRVQVKEPVQNGPLMAVHMRCAISWTVPQACDHAVPEHTKPTPEPEYVDSS